MVKIVPRVHRDTDLRICGAATIVVGQSTVFVNNLLWAVDFDIDTHCNAGPLKPITAPRNVYVENKLVICAPGDAFYSPDYLGCFLPHSPFPVGGSPNTYVYGGVGGGS